MEMFKMLAVVSLTVLLTIQTGEALQCYRCSYNLLQTDGAVGTFLNWFSKLASDEHCKMERAGDITEIGIRNCPEGSGKVPKCSDIKGVVTTTVDLPLIGSQEFRYHTVTRDCVLVPPEEADYKNGCHEHLPSYGPVRSLFQTFFGGTEIGAIQFEGEACYNTREFFISSDAASPHKMASHVAHLAMLACLVVLLFMR